MVPPSGGAAHAFSREHAREVYIHQPETSKRASPADRQPSGLGNIPQNQPRPSQDRQNPPAGGFDASEADGRRIPVRHLAHAFDEVDESGNKAQQQADDHRPRIGAQKPVQAVSQPAADERCGHKVPAQRREVRVPHAPANSLVPGLPWRFVPRGYAARLRGRVSAHARFLFRMTGNAAVPERTGGNVSAPQAGVKGDAPSGAEKYPRAHWRVEVRMRGAGCGFRKMAPGGPCRPPCASALLARGLGEGLRDLLRSFQRVPGGIGEHEDQGGGAGEEAEQDGERIVARQVVQQPAHEPARRHA